MKRLLLILSFLTLGVTTYCQSNQHVKYIDSLLSKKKRAVVVKHNDSTGNYVFFYDKATQSLLQANHSRIFNNKLNYSSFIYRFHNGELMKVKAVWISGKIRATGEYYFENILVYKEERGIDINADEFIRNSQQILSLSEKHKRIN